MGEALDRHDKAYSRTMIDGSYEGQNIHANYSYAFMFMYVV
jgi:hypothetical protein